MLRQRPPKPSKLLKIFNSFVTTEESRHACTYHLKEPETMFNCITEIIKKLTSSLVASQKIMSICQLKVTFGERQSGSRDQNQLGVGIESFSKQDRVP